MDIAPPTSAEIGDTESTSEAYAEFWMSFDADDEAAPAKVIDRNGGDAYEQFWKLADAD